MFKPEFSQFIRDYAVQSKLGSTSVVSKFGEHLFVFMGGYPMTERAFYHLSSKAIFGEAVRHSKTTWSELHAETRLLCQGLNVELTEGRESLNVIHAMRKVLNWTKSSTEYDNHKINTWVADTTAELETKRREINNLNDHTSV